ncbi:hypothetical protein SDRG_00350 [Saprolegnia diclina VS20]|uniref:Metalloendopeptidase n=1 Tax=Saprolegnia diclina (strain VS20) TaxID=1156394 RepID=T0R6R9_SAPDV|nr:hypothetical protein SDRG_00350 [Saprolegnia diclina VS20]EQC42621.1 hypothetical protein SDRG_00350 [Saprolegnia diclina VS20]|eukprot:XP_008604044.1 hypothetical protein SDRG_00350 [Saprolegnia diclina VS20]
MDPDVNATAIYGAMAVWEAQTPLRFLPCRSNSTACCDPCGDYVHIQGGAGCYASLGYVAGACEFGGQALVLGPACAIGNIIHELGHTVGLVHEHQRADRDDYVKIYVENIDPLHVPDFAKGSILLHGSNVSIVSLWAATDNYDYDSIMHYGLHDFSINQLQTLLPITRVGDRDTVREDLFARLGQRQRLSTGDVQAITELYGGEVAR